ncbi:type VII secretion protein EccE [Micromonospora sonneratiae]|uniref:Type VII secretion protein EccE n=1 Tax=Micromonospora sonneratiae TaxID=1184706 RepID=A0ABW3YQ41_9ACTN
MTERNAGPAAMSPQQTHAGTRAGPTPAEQSGPVILLPRRRPGHLGPVHITQLLLAEAAIVAVLTTVSRGWVIAVGAAVGAAILLLVTLSRRQGRWWLERWLMSRRYRQRRQVTLGSSYHDDPRLGLLHTLAPGLVVEDVETINGGRVGVARDDSGWFAVAQVSNSTMGDASGSVPLEPMAAVLAEIEQPGVVLQMVTQVVPSPSIDAHPSSPAAYSYRQLLAGFGSAPVPADRTTWIAVRLDARSLAKALGDGWADLETAPAVVAALVRRIAKSLRQVGISHRLVDANGLLALLARSCDLEPVGGNQDPTPPREEWSAWHSSRFAHRSFWIRGWPPIDEAAALLQNLSSTPAAMTTIAMILASDEANGLLDLRGLVRVSAPAPELNQMCQLMTSQARQSRADLFQLDGEQGPAVYATAPTGGGQR